MSNEFCLFIFSIIFFGQVLIIEVSVYSMIDALLLKTESVMEITEVFYPSKRGRWRKWLQTNPDFLVFPMACFTLGY